MSAAFSSAQSARSDAPPPAQVAIEYDFGVVRPSTKLSHRFSIKNESHSDWTLKKIHVNCLCTVPGDSPTVVRAGHSEEYEIEYKAPSKCADDRRDVTVEFNERAAPLARLIVAAKVRTPMSVFPPELDLGQISDVREIQSHLEVHNHGDRDWSGLTAAASDDAPWLACTASLVRRGSAESRDTAPRQMWRIVVRADASALRSGQQQGELRLTAQGEDGEQATVPVRIGVTPSVQVIPGQFFFGRVAAGKSVTRKVAFAFAGNAVPKSAKAASFRCEPSGIVELAWARTEGRFWELAATVTARDVSGAVDGTVEIEFKGERLPTLEIPIHAFVEAQNAP